MNRNDIVTLHALLQNSRVGVNDGNIMAFRGKLAGQHGANLTVACNNDIHTKPPENGMLTKNSSDYPVL